MASQRDARRARGHPGDLNRWVAGILGATLVVWVTFVPCFLFVFLGAPHIEALRHNRRISAALTGAAAYLATH